MKVTCGVRNAGDVAGTHKVTMAKSRKVKRKSKITKSDYAAFVKIGVWLDTIQEHLQKEQYDEALTLCKRVVSHRKATRVQKADAYGYMGNAYGMQQEFDLAYEANHLAIKYEPSNWIHYFNRGLSASYQMRLGHALRDYEKAVELCDDSTMLGEVETRAANMKRMVEDECALRGADFTVDDLIAQRNLFDEGRMFLQQRDGASAIERFKMALAMGEDCLPQPHFNIGSGYAMLGDWDSAEAAWKHALELDEEYEPAQKNLAMLPFLRDGMPFEGEVNSMKGQVENISMKVLKV